MALTSLTGLMLPLSAVATGPILARALDPAGRGELAAVLAPLAVAPFVFNFGVPEALTYFVASKRISVRAATRTAAAAGAIAGAAAFAALAALSPVLFHRYEHLQSLFVLLAATLPLVMAMTMLRAVAQGRQRFDLINRERWFSIVSRLALIAGLATVGRLTVTGAAWSTHATALVAFLFLLPILKSARGDAGARIGLAAIARYGGRTWIGTLSGIMMLRLDQVLLVPLAGARQLGYYAVAVSLAEIPAAALLSVRDVAFAAATDRDDPSLVARACRMVVLVSAPLCLLGVAAAPLAIPLAFGDRFTAAVPMAQILFVASVPSGIATVLTAGLFGTNRPELVSLAQLTALALTIAGVFALVPTLGAIGAAWTSLAAYALAAALSTVALKRVTGIRPRDCLLPRRADWRDLQARVRAIRSARRSDAEAQQS
jgi:O-antigen/teichoic acid export membrane protein